MSKLSSQAFLLADQYKDAGNLNARAQLHARSSTNKYGWMRWVFDQFHLPAECRILELGCGAGTLWRDNLERVPAGWKITLTDFSPGMLEQAQENLRESGRGFAFEQVDAQSIPYDDERFDAVIANHMLYHVPDRPKALAEMRRVLKPGGRFYASTVGEGHTREIFEMVSRFDHEGRFQRETPSFTLENGAQELAQWFSGVTLHRYEDGLVVTEAEPLIAYVMSMVEARSVFTDDCLAELIAYVEGELAAHGAIHISKDSGMFEAFRSEKSKK
jgi:ubiquinone/menaquinone biosynthesis C-methylase UbiE